MKKIIPGFWFILKERLKGRNFLYEFYFKGKKTLDVGCGEGEFLRLDKSLISGVDLNKMVIDRLRAEGFDVKFSSAEAVPYQSDSFDMVHCHNVIEHLNINEAYKMINESTRVLKKGGLFIISSEVITKKFWNTFGHIKPYPPGAILKLLRKQSREEFEPVSSLEFAGLFYFGDYFENRMLYLISVFMAYYTPFFRREYFLILRKK